jgi:hypothetical protein
LSSGEVEGRLVFRRSDGIPEFDMRFDASDRLPRRMVPPLSRGTHTAWFTSKDGRRFAASFVVAEQAAAAERTIDPQELVWSEVRR